jgi:hypothetical protein
LFVSEKSVACLASACCQIKIESIHDYGMLCHAAFSADAITGALVDKLPSGPTCNVTLVEMKPKWYPELFKPSIPDALYQ